ncbi:hypothetical protein Bcep1808_7451 (plasmid) [Burkholderia vietnamiensis G4]|uniref:ParE-like toxin domain-containing protein n=1 Tax=Burkholderia vietnamiensis (strain G4 / LMG 22486) TaxID=269482 RepID=A4JVM5_BURVG|nr:hypothetical protein Bcep1808_7451 [Burkholderia vietnamiensis G4]
MQQGSEVVRCRKASSRGDTVGAAAERARLKASVAGAAIDLSAAAHLPAVLRRALKVLKRLEEGAHPLSLGAQILVRRGGDFSVPIGYSYRLLVDACTLRPTLFISHETYNGLV